MQTIRHYPEKNCFILLIDAAEAILEYVMVDANTVDFARTYVPDALRGRGVARELVDSGLAWAEQQGFEVQASCSYVAKVRERAQIS